MSSIGKRLKEGIELFCLFLRVRVDQWQEERKVRRLFYSNPLFKTCDQALRRAYRGCNPYRLSKRFLQQKGSQEIDLYGETYITSFAEMAIRFGITSKDHLVELGCGRGRGVFFLASHIGCFVTGVEWVPEFVLKARKILKEVEEKEEALPLAFIQQDMLSGAVDLTQATVIYLYGTCLEDADITKLLLSFAKLPKGVKIITVSYPLTDFERIEEGKTPLFRIKDVLRLAYPWGEADLFLQERT